MILPTPGYEESYITGTGVLLNRVHNVGTCAAEFCPIHNPSDHPLKDAPTHWRHGGFGDIKPPHMERICEHGIGHPDPDGLAADLALGMDVSSVHGCDGCCTDNYGFAVPPPFADSLDK